MTLLKQIQSTAQKIAEATAGVLNVEVTIVDTALVRIAGTGIYPIAIGRKVTDQSIYHSVIQNKRELVIQNSKMKKCNACDIRPSCNQLAELCCPIVLGTEVLGAIGLIACSPEQQHKILNETERLLAFVRHMAELIASKALEVTNIDRLIVMRNELQAVLNLIAEGVLAIDHMEKVTQINYAAEKMLRVKAQDVIGFHIDEILPGTPISEALLHGTGFSDREMSIWQKGRHHHYIINATPMIVEGVTKGVVANFREVTGLPFARTTAKVTFDSIIGNSQVMLELKADASKAAETSSTVLITGESGTGKEVLALAIHNESARFSKPFIPVNCAAIPEHLLESELFGYEEGSFTGAKKGGKPGKFQLANGGTLFLDEIGDMPLPLQAKILRVIQEKVVEPVGAIRSQPIDVRIIAATHRNLELLIAKEKFREDLFYRLNVFMLVIPPLRERPEDIIILANHLLKKYAQIFGKDTNVFAADAQKSLEKYNWPGNVRELENTIERAIVQASGKKIQKQDLPDKLQTYKPSVSNNPEKQAIIDALNLFGRSLVGKRKTADHLGIGIATLYRKIRKYNI